MWLPAEAELLLQIVERPDDDQLRLVLADHLINGGNPLGELIAIQCALRRPGDHLTLRARERELLSEHEGLWRDRVAPFADRVALERGLPRALWCKVEPLLEGGALMILAPIEELHLRSVRAEQLVKLLQLPLMRRVRTLGISSLSGVEALNLTLQMPPGLKRLRVVFETGPEAASATMAGLFAHVEHLEIGVMRGAENMPRLFQSNFAPQLTRLVLRSNVHIAEEAVQALAAQRPELMIEWQQRVFNPRPVEDDVPMAGPVLEPLPRGAPPIAPVYERVTPLPFTTITLAPDALPQRAPHRTHWLVLTLALILFSVLAMGFAASMVSSQHPIPAVLFAGALIAIVVMMRDLIRR